MKNSHYALSIERLSWNLECEWTGSGCENFSLSLFSHPSHNFLAFYVNRFFSFFHSEIPDSTAQWRKILISFQCVLPMWHAVRDGICVCSSTRGKVSNVTVYIASCECMCESANTVCACNKGANHSTNPSWHLLFLSQILKLLENYIRICSFLLRHVRLAQITSKKYIQI